MPKPLAFFKKNTYHTDDQIFNETEEMEKMQKNHRISNFIGYSVVCSLNCSKSAIGFGVFDEKVPKAVALKD